MSEVLSLQYDATSMSYDVTLDAVEERTDARGVKTVVTMVGRALPHTRFTHDELLAVDPVLAMELRSCIAQLEAHGRARIVADMADPEAVMRQAAQNRKDIDAIVSARAELDRATQEKSAAKGDDDAR